jgi:hypothetical protein
VLAFPRLPQANHEVVRQCLWRVTLEAPDTVAVSASQLLANIMSQQLQSICSSAEDWRQLLASEVLLRMQELRARALLPPVGGPAAGTGKGSGEPPPLELQTSQWCDPPPALSALPPPSLEGAAEGLQAQLAVESAAKHCQRILHYLALMAEECQVR